MNWFFKFYKFIKGALYYRFAIFVCLLGASFLAPQMWEGALWLFTRIINRIYTSGGVENYEIQNFSPEPQDYIIGTIIIALGILLFIYFYKQQTKRKNENDDYLNLSNLWIGLRDLRNKNPNIDDLRMAISTLNTTSDILLTTSESTIARFRKAWKDDFNTLYGRITDNDYQLDGKNSKEMLNDNVKPAKLLINGTN